MTIDLKILTFVLFIVIVLLVIWLIRLEYRLNRLLAGRNGRSLESSIRHIKAGLEEFEHYKSQTDSELNRIRARLKKTLRAVRTIRFNPFKGTGSGGNQSFATTFISEEGNGVVISSLYSRERVSVYAKPLTSFDSTFELSEEEKQSLSEARNQL